MQIVSALSATVTDAADTLCPPNPSLNHLSVMMDQNKSRLTNQSLSNVYPSVSYDLCLRVPPSCECPAPAIDLARQHGKHINTRKHWLPATQLCSEHSLISFQSIQHWQTLTPKSHWVGAIFCTSLEASTLSAGATLWGACLPVFPRDWKSDYLSPLMRQRFLTSTPLSPQLASNSSPTPRLNKVILWVGGGGFLMCEAQQYVCFCAVQGWQVQEDQDINTYIVCKQSESEGWNSAVFTLCRTAPSLLSSHPCGWWSFRELFTTDVDKVLKVEEAHKTPLYPSLSAGSEKVMCMHIKDRICYWFNLQLKSDSVIISLIIIALAVSTLPFSSSSMSITVLPALQSADGFCMHLQWSILLISCIALVYWGNFHLGAVKLYVVVVVVLFLLCSNILHHITMPEFCHLSKHKEIHKKN